MDETAWDELSSWGPQREGGMRALIPLIGAGFNAQAGKRKGWPDLLRDVVAEHRFELALPADEGFVGNTTLIWEAMVLKHATARRIQPNDAERELVKTAAHVLERAYPVGPSKNHFVEDFLAFDFSDVLSFNFDDGAHVVPPTFRAFEHQRFDRMRSHAVLANGTRVWYPHGNVRAPASILLGMRNYGILIGEFEKARAAYKQLEGALKVDLSMIPIEGRASTPEERHALWAVERERTQSWLTACMNAPLVFLGMSLGREEWPLWWFLNARARNHARRRIDVPVFAFLRSDETERIRIPGMLAKLRILSFDDFDAGWARLFRALEGR